MMKLFDTTKKNIIKTKNEENLPTLEVAEVVLVQCNLVDNQINKSLRYYILLRKVNFMVVNQAI